MFAHLDLSTFLICCSGHLSDNESEEKAVAICGASIYIDWTSNKGIVDEELGITLVDNPYR